MKQALLALSAIFMAATAVPAQADVLPDGASKATLISPAPTPIEAVIDGRIWHCTGASCDAAANDSADVQTLPHECHRTAIWLGKFSAYQTGAVALTDAQLTACNANVTTKTPRSPG
jgi:hypothetical protein